MRMVAHSFSRRELQCIGLLVAALIVKFFLPLALYGQPLGYDVGIYRFLFLRYSEALSHGHLPVLLPWAQEHPLGLFLTMSPLLIAGMPVDWLITWIWSLVPLALAAVLAWSVGKRHGTSVGIVVLLVALLSMPYQDGFAAMYWKTFASLFWGVLALHYFDRRFAVSVPALLLCLITHHQTGLLIALVVAVRWGVLLPSRWKDKHFVLFTALLGLVALLTLAFYVPVWQRAFLSPFLSLLQLHGDSAPSGSFPPLSFYLGGQGILVAFGLVGFLQSWKTERFTVWQIAVLWCLVFVCARLIFYNRFLLQLDFFLMPFCARAIVLFWRRFFGTTARVLIVVALLLQGFFTAKAFTIQKPVSDRQTYRAIMQLHTFVPQQASVLSLDNASVPALRGWLPDEENVGGPGLFGFEWTYDQWQQFLIGTHAQRAALIVGVPKPLYLVVTPYFLSYYGEHAAAFLKDPCVHPTRHPMLMFVDCPKP